MFEKLESYLKNSIPDSISVTKRKCGYSVEDLEFDIQKRSDLKRVGKANE